MSQTILRRKTATSSTIASGYLILQTARRRIGTLRSPPFSRLSPLPSWRSCGTIAANDDIEICNRLIAFGRQDVLQSDVEPENATAETLSAQTMSREIAQAVETEHVHPKTPPLHMTSKLSDEDEASIEATINVTVGEIMKIEDAAFIEAALNDFVE